MQREVVHYLSSLAGEPSEMSLQTLKSTQGAYGLVGKEEPARKFNNAGKYAIPMSSDFVSTFYHVCGLRRLDALESHNKTVEVRFERIETVNAGNEVRFERQEIVNAENDGILQNIVGSELKKEKAPEECAMCAQPTHSGVCSSCKTVRYCSSKCQHAHWQAHKPLCSQIKKDNEKMKDQAQKN